MNLQRPIILVAIMDICFCFDELASQAPNGSAFSMFFMRPTTAVAALLRRLTSDTWHAHVLNGTDILSFDHLTTILLTLSLAFLSSITMRAHACTYFDKMSCDTFCMKESQRVIEPRLSSLKTQRLYQPKNAGARVLLRHLCTTLDAARFSIFCLLACSDQRMREVATDMFFHRKMIAFALA